jgi:transposase
MRRLFWLSDRQFELIKPHLPYRAAGKRREDDRRIISGIIHVLQSGCRWRDCPPEYGPSTTVRFDLLFPKFGPSFRQLTAFAIRVTVPKTPMNEYHFSANGKN